MERVLIVDDDHMLLDVVTFLLRRAGVESLVASSAAEATRLFVEVPPDLVILDIGLGDADGRVLLQEFRRLRPAVMILMLTALSAEDDRVATLELGADDYLSKPFGHRELVARVRALLRRRTREGREPVQPTRLQVGEIVLDPLTHEVTRDGEPLDLTPTEFRLLQALMTRPDTLVSTLTLLKEVWGHSDLTARNVVRVTASRLRAKLEADPAHPRYLHTVSGEGLLLRDRGPAHTVETPGRSEPPVTLDVASELRELLGDDQGAAFRELHAAFQQSTRASLDVMRAAVARDDCRQVRMEAHRVRGSSAIVGAPRLAALAATLEQRALAEQLETASELLDQLSAELDHFADAMTPLLEATER